MIGRFILLIPLIIASALPSGAVQPAFETIRIGIPGKLVDFAPFFVGLKTGIYRSEELKPTFSVMRNGVINIIYTRAHKQEALPLLMKEFPGMERNTLEGTLDFYLKAMSPDGRVSESIVHALINEQRELVNVKTAVPLNQVVDFGPLQRVVKELNPRK